MKLNESYTFAQTAAAVTKQCLSIQMSQLINDNYETAPCMAKIEDKGNISW